MQLAKHDSQPASAEGGSKGISSNPGKNSTQQYYWY